MTLHGIVIIDKPSGMTSHDVVDRARRIFRTKRVGHTGTLDPEATGVLVVCINNGTRLAQYLSASEKRYEAQFTFGIESDTQDIWGDVVKEADASGISSASVEAALPHFRGAIMQVPPMVSARRHEGRHLYELAREGVTVEREARPIEIYRLEMRDFLPGEKPTCTMEIVCSTGTYIRTIAHDVGQALGVGAVMSSLKRTIIGSGANAFDIQHANNLNELTALAKENPDALEHVVLPLSRAVANWPTATLNEETLARIRHGQMLGLDELVFNRIPNGDEPVALLEVCGDLAAVAQATEAGIKPVKVMA